jgi:hypothetical protein
MDDVPPDGTVERLRWLAGTDDAPSEQELVDHVYRDDSPAGQDASNPQVASDRVLARLMQLHPKKIDLSLGRTLRLLAALGNPHERLPPTIHVAGTNGKGSVVATLRACLEAAGQSVHVYTSPHLVRFNERIRLAGRLIEEDALLAVLEECERANEGAPITFFEITTAAAFLASIALDEHGLRCTADRTVARSQGQRRDGPPDARAQDLQPWRR